MEFWSEAYKQAIVLRSYAILGSRNDAERYRAMCALRECGTASRWCLALAIRQTGQPRVQFAAAVVMYWLGDRQGLLTLTEALKWRLPAEPALASDLEAAFVWIGSPDSVSALLTVWNMLPEWGDNEPVRASICRVWAALKNPAVLPALINGALLIPETFEHTVPVFGEMAIPSLQRMTRENDARHRHLAALTLRHIRGASAFTTLTPLLNDPDPGVRSIVPDALDQAGGRTAAVRAVSAAVREGFASPRALEMLCHEQPDDLFETLLAFSQAWTSVSGPGESSEMILPILPVLISSVDKAPRVLPALCGLLDRSKKSVVSLALLDSIEALSYRTLSIDASVRASVWKQVGASNPQVREKAASVLARLSEPFARQVVAFLNECIPQESLFSKLHVILRGGPDAGQAATQAVHQLSQWFARMGVDSTTRRASTSSSTDAVISDPRVPEVLRGMLIAGLSQFSTSHIEEDLGETAEFVALLLRAVGRTGMPGAIHVWSQVITALNLAHNVNGPADRDVRGNMEEAIRMTAAETLIELYGANSLPLFVEALYTTNTAVNRTAMIALGKLGDVRALAHLQQFKTPAHPLAEVAEQTSNLIRRTNPEMMSLLRGSSARIAKSDVLLRPASGNAATGADSLLRPTASQAE